MCSYTVHLQFLACKTYAPVFRIMHQGFLELVFHWIAVFFQLKGKTTAGVNRLQFNLVWYSFSNNNSTSGELHQWEPSVRECRASSQSILNFASLAFLGQGLSEPLCRILSDSFVTSPSTGDVRILKILLPSLLCYHINCSRVPGKPLEWHSHCEHSPACKAPRLCQSTEAHAHIPGTWGALQGAPCEWQTQQELSAERCWIYTILPFVQGSDVLFFPETLLAILLTLEQLKN